MNPTLCPRCGSLAERCECDELRREAFAIAESMCRQWARDGAGWSAEDYFNDAADAFAALARKQEKLK